LLGTPLKQQSSAAESEAAGATVPKRVSSASLRGLDGFVFFVADIQTGWGPFVAAYLTSVGWLQFDIGLILTIGTMTAFVLRILVGAVPPYRGQ